MSEVDLVAIREEYQYGSDVASRDVIILADEVERLREALKLPLIFHRGGYWTRDAADEWEQITGTREATTKIMCDAIRAVLHTGEKR